ncbi:MAG: hypothetical protein NZT92_08600 [Abditibacteriales bacterium]|nr:hypothetical protein [Abditibacteriales bacterium]MDW8366051.1 hypothetical protein [Abditibacteriales bacterium]
MAQEPEQSSSPPTPSPYAPPPRAGGVGLGYFIVVAVVCLVVGLFAGGLLVRSRDSQVIEEKTSEVERLQRNMESTRNNLLRDARALLVRAQEDLGSGDAERALDGRKYIIRAKDLVDTVRTLATEDMEKAQIESLSKMLKDAEGRSADAAQADITRAISRIDTLMGRKASRRPPSPPPTSR